MFRGASLSTDLAPIAPALIGHNGGPPLDDEHRPEWGTGGVGSYFTWKSARKAALASVSRDVALFRIKRAERLGLTYEEYTIEILDRGRHLQASDTERIAEIIAARPKDR